MPSSSRFFSPRLLLALGVAAHAAIFLGLFQLDFSQAERARVKSLMKEGESPWHQIALTWQEFGPGGVLRWYFDEIEEVKLYYGHARLALDHDPSFLLYPPATPLPERPTVYRDVPLEYQPGALLQFVVPALVSREYPVYNYASAAWYLVLYLAAGAGALRLLLHRWPDALTAARAAGWSALFILCFGKLASFRFDHAVPFFVVLALLAFDRARSTPGRAAIAWHAVFGLIAAAGALTKITPGLVVPAAWIVLAGRVDGPEWRRIVVAQGAGLAAGLSALSLWFHVWFGQGYWDSFRYHALRGIQLESIYAGFAGVMSALGWRAHTGMSFGAFEIFSPLNPAMLVLGPLLFLALGAIVFLKTRPPVSPRPEASAGAVLVGTIALLLAFVLTNKVFSPQFLLWIAPLLAALATVRPELRNMMLLWLVIAGLTQAIYPSFYTSLIHLEPLGLTLLNLRNVLLAIFVALFFRRLPALLAAGGQPVRS